MMRICALIVTASVLLAGCVGLESYAPPDSAEFQDVYTLAALEGTYANKGESFWEHNPPYLSSVIWRDGKRLVHTTIEVVTVDAVGDSVLIVRGLAEGETLREGRFVRGRDFELRSGQLHLTPVQDWQSLEDFSVGNRTERVVFGLDERGRGKVQKSSKEAGLFLVVPYAGASSTEYQFRRIDTKTYGTPQPN